MTWRGQGGGRRARGRRGDQDPELDNTAWLAELERAAGEVDDEEEDWASKLRGGRAPGPPVAGPPPTVPGPPPAAEPSWSPPAEPPPPDYRLLGMEPDGSGSSGWDAGRSTQDHPPTPAPAPSRDPEPDWLGSDPDPGGSTWPPAGVDTPTGAWEPAEPAGREPDYPALFGELYRRSAGQQDPTWEPPPAAEPLPEPGQPDPSAHAWPFEETTQTWEPSDRSFVWPAEELPSSTSSWESTSPSWMDDPPAQPPSWAAPTPPPPVVDDHGPPTRAFDNPVPPMPAPAQPPPADWAAAIPADVPAARRAQSPGTGPATRAWRPDETLEAEPAVPLDTAERPHATAAAPAPAETADARRTRPPEGRRIRQLDDRPRSAWPRVVAVISWIVLIMVVCWFYAFPWLERVLPESF